MSGDRDGTSSARRRQLLRAQHLGPKTTPEGENWRPGIEDLEDVPFAGVGVWRPIGPAPLIVQREQALNGTGPNAGDVLDVAMSPLGAGSPTLYVATHGGVWRSTADARGWEPLTDVLPSSVIGAVAVDAFDPTVVYAGTRDLVDGSGTVPRAMGAWRSDDEGATWAPLDGGPDATVLGKGINHIVTPIPDVVLVGCTDGLYLSVNGGTSFGANAPEFNDGKPLRSGNVSALAVDSALHTTLPISSTRRESTSSQTIVVECAAHGFESEDVVFVHGSADAEAAGSWTIDVIDADRFTLRGSATSATGGAQGFVVGRRHQVRLAVQGATFSAAAPAIVITTPNHGMISGDIVAVGELPGVPTATGSWPIRVRSNDTFELVGSKGTGAYTSGGVVEAPRHAPARAIAASANVTDGVEVQVPGHEFVDGDRVSVSGLPGIAAAATGVVRRGSQPDKFVVTGLKMSVASQGAGGTVTGPASAWNMIYFAIAGRTPDGAKAQTGSGLFRLTLTGDNRVALSGDLAGVPSIKGKYDHLVFAQALLPRSRTLFLAAQATHPTTRFLDCFRSDDFGATWRSIVTSAFSKQLNADGTGASDACLTLGVDPRESRRLYLGMRQLWISPDGGASWPAGSLETAGGDLRDSVAQLGASPSMGRLPHHHFAMTFVPQLFWPPDATPTPPTPVVFGTSGGVARSDDGATTFTHLNHGLSISLCTSVDLGRKGLDRNVTAVALDDIGVATTRDTSGYAWRQGISGTVGDVAVDPFDANVVYAFIDGKFARSVNAGVDWIDSSERRPVLSAIRKFTTVQIDTLGHPFSKKASVTIRDVTSNGTPLAAVNGPRVVTADDTPILTVDGINGNTLPAVDRLATAFGNRFVRELGIVRVRPGTPITVETAAPHGIATTANVHVEGVRSLAAANNTETNISWVAERVSDTVLRLVGSAAPAATDLAERAGRVRISDGSGEVAIQFATNGKPIVVTAIDHGFVTGQTVSISGVRGNTNANFNDRRITVIDRCSFRLDVDGNGAFATQPSVEGFALGFGLPASSGTDQQRIALVPEIDAITKTVFVSVRNTVYRSDDHGLTFNAIRTFDRDVTALAFVGIRLWAGLAAKGGKGGTVQVGLGRSYDWRTTGPNADYVDDVGARGTISSVAIDPTNGDRVAVVVSGYTDVPMQRGTHHCFVTTSGGIKTLFRDQPWEEAKNFTRSEPALPDLPAHSAVFVRTTGDSDLLVATEGGVMRRTALGWDRYGPNLPTISCQRLVVDNTPQAGAASVVRVATHGRGVWQLEIPADQRLVVRGSLGFGERLMNRQAKLPLTLYNAGAKTLKISGIDIDDAAFGIQSPPTTPVVIEIPSGKLQQLAITFTPTNTDFKTANIKITSDDPEHPVIVVRASGFGVAKGLPRVSVRRRVIHFGNTDAPGFGETLRFKINNTGTGDADITRAALVTPANPAFSFSTPNAVPFVLRAGESVEVELEFDPTKLGPAKATLRIESRPAGTTSPPATIDVRIDGTGTARNAGILARAMSAIGLTRDEPALA